MADEFSWRHPPAAKFAVVVKGSAFAEANRKTIQKQFPGFRVLVPGEALLGHRFERIVMLWRPTQGNDFGWLNEQLMLKLVPPAKLEWLV